MGRQGAGRKGQEDLEYMVLLGSIVEAFAIPS